MSTPDSEGHWQGSVSGASTRLVHGLAVSGELEIPGAPVLEGDGRVPDIQLIVGPPGTRVIGHGMPVVTTEARPGEPACAVYRDEGAVAIRFAGLFDVRISEEADVVTVVPALEVDPYLLTDLLLGLPLAYVLFRHGAIPLHASAVAFGTRAVSCVAPSMTGKSTLAAACLTRGAVLIADDLVPLYTEPPPAHVRPGLPTVRLSEQSVAILGRTSVPNLRATRPGWKHWQAEAPAPDARYAAALFLLLERADGSVPEKAAQQVSGLIEDLSPADALVRLGDQIYGFGMFTPDERRQVLARLAAVVGQTRVARLVIPDNLGRIGEMAQAIEQLATEPVT